MNPELISTVGQIAGAAIKVVMGLIQKCSQPGMSPEEIKAECDAAKREAIRILDDQQAQEERENAIARGEG